MNHSSPQDTRVSQGAQGDPHHLEHGSSSSAAERGGRSVSRERGAATKQPSAATSASRSKLNGLDLLDEDTDAGPAISSADIDQLMEDFDLNDPLMEPEPKPAEPAPPPKEEVKEEKPGGLAGALPGGLGAGLSGLPNPMGEGNLMGKLGDLATQNPVTDVMSMGKNFLFKKFGL